MKTIRLSTAILSFSILLFACGAQEEKTDSNAYEEVETFVPNPQELEEQEVSKLAIGDKAPYFRLPNIDGKFVSIDDFEDADVLVINFTCNHCPTAQAYEERFIDVVDEYKNKNVAFVAISPNSPIGLLPEELGYTDLSDDFEAMQIRYEDMNYNFPYLYDGDIHEYSLAYGPTATPHVFVFDKERKLSYSGRLDASEKPGTANAEDLRKAIEKTLAGEALDEDEAITPAFGCSTKWAWKNEFTKKTNEEWKKKPVDVEKISPEGLAKLLKNETDELLLINFWATWCGPCIVEYPEFIEIQRMYGDRDFQFVSLSMDNPNQEDKVLKFLKSKYSAVPNYLIDTEDKYAVIDVVGKDWDGSLPITLLIEPGGNIAHKVMGEIKPLELKRAIVDHPMIGRYY
ncbi:MAG: redoxin [Mongoliibacter sp.]|uniref:redoxin domain-containing protein n=1 Tax=Mongoliibacter sp. TaxID=2022438 RepID=UPI0012F28261|nr:redoxin domain-containing protein [Mongoliibacter sp.]TVP48645.1 MAG: redoxin [Mongoliibacter sp.]